MAIPDQPQPQLLLLPVSPLLFLHGGIALLLHSLVTPAPGLATFLPPRLLGVGQVCFWDQVSSLLVTLLALQRCGELPENASRPLYLVLKCFTSFRWKVLGVQEVASG